MKRRSVHTVCFGKTKKLTNCAIVRGVLRNGNLAMVVVMVVVVMTLVV